MKLSKEMISLKKISKIGVLFLITEMLMSCDSNRHKVSLSYREIGGIEQVTCSQYKMLFVSQENIVSFISLKDKDYCASCYGGSLTDIEQYAIDNHFIIYHLEFDFESDSFIIDYNDLANFMSKNNDNGIKEITEYKDNLPIITSLPCLILSNSGYIGYNVNDGFIPKLKETVYAQK